MKKIVSFVLVICLALTSLVLISCKKEKTLDDFYAEMLETESFRMEMSMTVMGQTMKETLMVDGGVSRTLESEMSNESYLVEGENGVEEYVKDVFGKWIKSNYTPFEDDLDGVFEKEMESLFKSENYNVEKNVYTQRDDVEFESFKDVKITVEEDRCDVLMTMMQSGMELVVKLEISKVGEIDLKLPKEYITVDIPDNNIAASNALSRNQYSVQRLTTKTPINSVLNNFGASGADAYAIVVASTGQQSVILIYCSGEESAETVYDAVLELYNSSYREVVDTYGKDSEEYNKLYELSKDEIIGRDGNIVCMASSLECLNNAK